MYEISIRCLWIHWSPLLWSYCSLLFEGCKWQTIKTIRPQCIIFKRLISWRRTNLFLWWTVLCIDESVGSNVILCSHFEVNLPEKRYKPCICSKPIVYYPNYNAGMCMSFGNTVNWISVMKMTICFRIWDSTLLLLENISVFVERMHYVCPASIYAIC